MRLAIAFALALGLAPLPAVAQDGDAENGARVFRQCAACHSLDEGRRMVGPSLYGLWGRVSGTVEGFRYSNAMTDAAITWSPETLDTYVESPRGVVAGTTMAFAGLRDAQQRADLIAYLIQELGAPE